jgi:prevent-host-death family protein
MSVFDHGLRPWYNLAMEEIAISKFKATCLAVLERVRKTGQPILVTRFGKPVAEVTPPKPARQAMRLLGSMRGTAEIIGDIVNESAFEPDWEENWLAKWDEIESRAAEKEARGRAREAAKPKRKRA